MLKIIFDNISIERLMLSKITAEILESSLTANGSILMMRENILRAMKPNDCKRKLQETILHFLGVFYTLLINI